MYSFSIGTVRRGRGRGWRGRAVRRDGAAVAEAQLSEAEAANSRRGGAPLTKEEWDEISRERQVERERQKFVRQCEGLEAQVKDVTSELAERNRSAEALRTTVRESQKDMQDLTRDVEARGEKEAGCGGQAVKRGGAESDDELDGSEGFAGSWSSLIV